MSSSHRSSRSFPVNGTCRVRFTWASRTLVPDINPRFFLQDKDVADTWLDSPTILPFPSSKTHLQFYLMTRNSSAILRQMEASSTSLDYNHVVLRDVPPIIVKYANYPMTDPVEADDHSRMLFAYLFWTYVRAFQYFWIVLIGFRNTTLRARLSQSIQCRVLIVLEVSAAVVVVVDRCFGGRQA